MTQSEDQKKKIETVTSGDTGEAEQIDEIAKIRGWFRPKETSAYYPTIEKYLNGDVDLKTTTSTLFSPIDQKVAARQLDDVDFLDLWYSVLHAARRRNFHQAQDAGRREEHIHGKIADIIAAFREHRVPHLDEYDYLYSALTDLSLACREVFNDMPKPDASSVEIDAWANLNFFHARVTAKGLQDLSIHAIWSMRAALEDEAQDDEEGTAVQKYNVHVPAAAAWVFGLGRALYVKEADLTPSDPLKGNPAKGGKLWKGKAEFSKERWAFWKERLAVISKMEGVSEKTKNISKDAIQAMERAESFSDSSHSAGAGSLT